MTFNEWIIENWFALMVGPSLVVYLVMASKAASTASIQKLKDQGHIPR